MARESHHSKTKVKKRKMGASRASKASYSAAYTYEIMRVLETRDNLEVYEMQNGKEVDVTPKYITIEGATEKFKKLYTEASAHILVQQGSGTSIASKRSAGSSVSARGQSLARMTLGGMRLSMDDIMMGIGSTRLIFDPESETSSGYLPDERTVHRLPFIRIVLRKTECILLYEHRSLISLKGTKDAEEAEYDNQLYDYLTIGKGKIRRQSESEAQTDVVLSKTRETNTNYICSMDRGTYVSYFEMFDTYEALAMAKRTLQPLQLTQKLAPPILQLSAQVAAIGNSPNFHAASMVVKRLLAGNEYGEGQRRFRNMKMPHRLDKIVNYHYSVNILFRYISLHELQKRGRRKAVADLSFCCGNGDILAVAYGMFSYTSLSTLSSGVVYIWSAKNPGDPERVYNYDVPVTAVEFSPYVPSLLAIGLFDGCVEVRDITNPHDAPLAKSQRTTSPSFEPVMAIKWIKQAESDDANGIDPFLSLSQDGTVTKYHIINSPYLMGFKQMMLNRVEGNPEGLIDRSVVEFPLQANRHPQGLNFTMHPAHNDIYYLLTDEGCFHKCSTNYTHQYLEVWKAHLGSVNTMDFSPWSPKLFVTCGNDWYIRVWMDGIFKPLITLQNGLNPVHCAYWSRTHSTIIISLNRISLDIWDIRRNILQPVAITTLDSSFNTIAKFSRCGRSIAVGNERGNILMCSLDDMPFASHFQYDELEKALFQSIDTFPALKNELKSVGFFGYRNKEFVNPM